MKAPRQKLGKGKTPVLTAEEAGELLRSIESDTVTLVGVLLPELCCAAERRSVPQAEVGRLISGCRPPAV